MYKHLRDSLIVINIVVWGLGLFKALSWLAIWFQGVSYVG